MHSAPWARHTSSKTWVSPRYLESEPSRLLKAARRKFCPKSTFWTEDFNLVKHKQEWAAGQARYMAYRKQQQSQKQSRKTSILQQDSWRSKPTQTPTISLIRPPFDDKEPTTHHSWTLYRETVFTPHFHKGKFQIAPWPNKAEMKYEGDDRISTDRVHRRFLGLPRVEGNDTVNWQHRAPIEQFEFDDFLYIPTEENIWFLMNHVPGLQFADDEGVVALGRELMEALDPRDQW